MFFAKPAYAHGGGLDASGGHNCYVGSCSGTYHFHGGGFVDLIGDNLGIILFLAIIAAAIFTLRKETKDSNQLPKFRDEPLKNILEPIGLGRLADSSPEYREKKLLLIHGPDLIELERFSGSLEIKEKSLELLKLSLNLKTEYSSKYKYFKTQNRVTSTPEYPNLGDRSNIKLFLVKREETLISIEKTRDGYSEGFLHPKLIEDIDNKLFEVNENGQWPIATNITEITFKEFSSSWKDRSSKFQNSRWDRWLRDFYSTEKEFDKTESQSQTIHQEYDTGLENSTTDEKIQSTEIDVVTVDRDKSLSTSGDFLVKSFIEEKLLIDKDTGYFNSIEAIEFIAGFSDTFLTLETKGQYLKLNRHEQESIIKEIIQRILPDAKDDPTIFEKIDIIDDDLNSNSWKAGMDRGFEATSDDDWIFTKTWLKIDWLEEYTKWADEV